MIWRIFKYLEHFFYFRHRNGHGIHSPYLFDYVNKVIFNSSGTEAPEQVLMEHRNLRSKYPFVRHSSVSKKYGLLLYRISRWFKPEMIVELGTGMGISGMYLASGSPGTPLHSIEGDRERAQLASGLLQRICPGVLHLHCGSMDEELEKALAHIPPRFMAFVDGNHHYEPTVAYVRSLVDKAGEEALIVMDDIYWSKGMYLAWKEVLNWPEVRVSIDLFHMGILLLRRDLPKKEIKIKF